MIAGGFAGSQTEVVSRTSNGAPHEVTMLINGLYNCCHDDRENLIAATGLLELADIQ